MPNQAISTGFSPLVDHSKSSFTVLNEAGDELSAKLVVDGVLRVQYRTKLALIEESEDGSNLLDNEPSSIPSDMPPSSEPLTLDISSPSCRAVLEYGLSRGPRVSCFSSSQTEPFFRDSATRAYSFDERSGDIIHIVERELYLPTSEDDPSTLLYAERARYFAQRDEFVYGLGETTGDLLKEPRRYTLDPRDSLGYDPARGDGMYKYSPFYLVYRRSMNLWYGMYYNTRSKSSSDFGSETDALFGSFRTFRTTGTSLEYYIILGDGTLPTIIEQYARLVTPTPARSPESTSGVLLSARSWRASSTLPPLSQLGYLASSLGLAARHDAQDAILQFVSECRTKGFPIDGLHLSSGWCQDEDTDVRNVFVWNRTRYPQPDLLGAQLEESLSRSEPVSTTTTPNSDDSHLTSTASIKVLVNVKPWVLDAHPWRRTILDEAFVRSGSNLRSPEKSLLWSRGLGEHALGSYIDFTSIEGQTWWKDMIRRELLEKHMTGIWIDNNEFSRLIRDDALFAMDPSLTGDFGYEAGKTRSVGEVGRTVQTLGMAKATYDAILEYSPTSRPAIVSRSFAPGMQAYAHSSWSGDNITSWASLRLSTAMTLSVGLSFGSGLYGHDIGGFAPSTLSPSPELLVRWVQHGAWHTRFVVHSWKEIDTRLWMYDGVEVEGVDVGTVIRDAVKMRYMLLPTFYSFYVHEYWKHGWPVLKPMLWHHSNDPLTLSLQDQFIFGSHILVAPVVHKGHRSKTVYLPAQTIGEQEPTWWCEFDTGNWHGPVAHGDRTGRFVELAAPINRVPGLVRAGGALMLGAPCALNTSESSHERTLVIFPAPPSADSSGVTRGKLVLIEDDGTSNEHTVHDKYTELEFFFHSNSGQVVVGYSVVCARFALPYDFVYVRLPRGDLREVVAAPGQTLEDGGMSIGGDRFWRLNVQLDGMD